MRNIFNILLILVLFIAAILWVFVYDPLRADVTKLLDELENVEVLGVSGDTDVGISTIIKPIDRSPVGFVEVTPEDFGKSGNILLFFVGDFYISVFKSRDNTPFISIVNISKTLNEGGLLEKPIVSMQQIESRFQELEQAFLNIPLCPEYRETTNSNGIKFKTCIFKKKNECPPVGKEAYKCMWDGINEWGIIE